MTLSTDVYVLDEISAHEVFHFCQGLLAKYDDEKRPSEQQQWTDQQDPTWRAGEPIIEPGNAWSLDNKPMQSLPAWLMLAYRPEESLRTAEQAAEHDEYCEEDCDGEGHARACWLTVDFDTAYGYMSPDGMGCGDLHAALVAELGQWLDTKGIRWEWRNEYTSDVHSGEDRYERLIDLCRAGFESRAWFETTVLPAIRARIA